MEKKNPSEIYIFLVENVLMFVQYTITGKYESPKMNHAVMGLTAWPMFLDICILFHVYFVKMLIMPKFKLGIHVFSVKVP